MPNTVSDKTVQSWLWSRKVIADFLLQLFPAMSQKNPDLPDETIAESNASAIIARLASHDPPLLICTMDEMKDE
jgi:hypothetical protein